MSRLRHWAGRYGLALLAVALSALLRWLMPDVLSRAPYLGFYPAVVVAAALGGVWPGLVATFGSLLLVNFVFVQFDFFDYGLQMRNVIWIVGGIGVSFLAGRLLEARERVEDFNAELEARVAAQTAEIRAANAMLEQRVAERTRQLQAANTEMQRSRRAALNLAQDTAAARVRAEQVATALRESEETLRGAREWLRVTLSSIGDAVLAADTAGRVTFVNPVATAITGWNPEEAEGQPIQNVFKIINEQSRVPAEDIVARVLKEGNVVELANHTALITKDGREIPIEDSAAPIRNRSGKVVGVVLVFHDVTEKRRAEQAIRESEEQLRMQMERMPIGCIVFDQHNCFSQMNPAAERIFGYSATELRGQHANVIVPEAARPHVHGIMRRLAGGDMTAHSENENVTKEGRAIVCQWTNTPLRDGAGDFIGFLSMVQDITDRKQAEGALLRSEKLASVGRMAATIAHEINNPLAAVTNALFLAQTVPDLPEAARRFLATADEELRRVAHITRQALGFYREASAPTRTSVTAVLDSAIALLKNRIGARRAVVEKQWDRDVQITAVAGELRQVFTNLLSNSLDAIDQQGVIKLRVSVSTNNGNRQVRITVADNGSGIPPNSRPHIFEPFFTTKGEVGTGLGLWVSKQITEKHGGKIHLHSSTDGNRRGTVVSVVFPMEAAAAAHSQSAGA
jgi:PAS domain S-box-containing protein